LDGQLSPGDSQLAFQIYLNCEALNPGVDAYCAADFCGFGRVEPCTDAVTPGDALAIFRAYLGYSDPCNAKAALNKTGKSQPAETWLQATHDGQAGTVTVVLETIVGSGGLGAWGVQLRTNGDLLELIAVDRGTLDPGWLYFGGSEPGPGKVLAGGVVIDPLPPGTTGSLAEFTFGLLADVIIDNPTSLFSIERLEDDLAAQE